MRGAKSTLVLALAALLSGCSEAPPTDAATVPGAPQLVTPPLVVVAQGTFEFNEVTGPGPQNILQAYDIVTQVAVNPCSWEGGAYFNNRQIPTTGGSYPARNGTMRVTFDWAETDYPMPTLVLGYRAPGMDALVDSPRVPRGETIEVRVEHDGRDGGSWVLYACMNRSDENVVLDPAWQPGPFLGSFSVKVDFQGDPEPVAAPVLDDGHRTSRDG